MEEILTNRIKYFWKEIPVDDNLIEALHNYPPEFISLLKNNNYKVEVTFREDITNIIGLSLVADKMRLLLKSRLETKNKMYYPVAFFDWFMVETKVNDTMRRNTGLLRFTEKHIDTNNPPALVNLRNYINLYNDGLAKSHVDLMHTIWKQLIEYKYSMPNVPLRYFPDLYDGMHFFIDENNDPKLTLEYMWKYLSTDINEINVKLPYAELITSFARAFSSAQMKNVGEKSKPYQIYMQFKDGTIYDASVRMNGKYYVEYVIMSNRKLANDLIGYRSPSIRANNFQLTENQLKRYTAYLALALNTKHPHYHEIVFGAPGNAIRTNWVQAAEFVGNRILESGAEIFAVYPYLIELGTPIFFKNCDFITVARFSLAELGLQNESGVLINHLHSF